MTVDVWLPWAIVGACALLNLSMSLANAAFTPAGPGLAGMGLGNGGIEEDEHQPRLNGNARGALNALRWASLLGICAALPLGLEGTRMTVSGIAYGVLAALGIGLATGVVSAAAGNRWSGALKTALSPVASAFNLGSSLPGASAVSSFITGRKSGDAASDEEVSAALRESLDLLEAARIPEGEEELRMIRGVLRMDTVKVREIMRPRVDVLAAEAGSNAGDVTEMMAVGGYSKIPVYEDSIDNVTGVIYARDLLGAKDKDGGGLVQKLARPAMFVPESQNLERLLQNFQERRTSIAIVVDEYGGVSGLVTVTDLIEEIVGELEDEFDVGEPELQRISESESLIDAGASIDLFNEKVGAEIEAEGFDTVGGLVYRELGKIPVNGDTVRVDGLEITVQSTIGRRIRRVRVRRVG